jgi:hypothetical protein
LKSELNSDQLEKVFRVVESDLKGASWPRVDPRQQERSITQHVVRPVIETTLERIGEKRLLLGSDGLKVPKPILKFGMSFSPDLEIRFFHQKCIAFEVKVLRDSDASGSLTKAIGQTLVYKNLGFEYAICLIFDARPRRNSDLEEFLEQKIAKKSEFTFIYN